MPVERRRTPGEPDEYVVARILEALASDPRTSELHVQVSIAGGSIFLTGTVPTEERREAVAQVVVEVCPDCDLRNQTTVAAVEETEHTERLT